MPKHILFILDYYTPHRGGSETVFENVISRLLEKGYEISILTSRFVSTLPREEHHPKLSVYRVAKSRLGFVFAAFFRGRRILRAHKDIPIIHTSTYGGAIPASLLGYFFQKRVILTVHEIFGKLWYLYKGIIGGTIYRIFEWLIFVLPYTIYHCVSQNTMNDIRRVYKVPLAKIHMIYNGVDTEFWNKKNVTTSEITSRRASHGRANYFVVLYYGHAGRSKGLDYLIDAIPGILKGDSKVLLVFNLIASKRTEKIKHRIQAIAAQMIGGFKPGSSSRIQIFNGFTQKELRLLVASADLIVAPSLSEGFGSVHTETVALGRPLLTTTAGPIPEVVRGNVKCIPPADTDQIISSVLDFAKGKIQENIPEKHFSRDATVDEIEKLYQ